MDVDDKQITPDQIGKETHWILRTTDFEASLARLWGARAVLRSHVHTERWAREIIFDDLYGNLWVLQEAGAANQLSLRRRA